MAVVDLNVDHLKSGALQYLKIDTLRNPTISFLMNDWKAPEQSNVVALPVRLLTSTTSLSFEARQNLLQIRSTLRDVVPVSGELYSDLVAAIARMDELQGEPADNWAESFSKDSASHLD